MQTTTSRIDVRAHGLELDGGHSVYARTHLSRALRPFRGQVHTVSVRLTDLNGPRGGGADLECRIVVTGTFPTVVISERAPSLNIAIDIAADRASHAVARAIGRMHTRRLG